MRKKIYISIIILCFSFATIQKAFSQVSLQWLIGVENPKGVGFEDINGEVFAGPGFSFDLDLLYKFKKLDNKVSVGLMCSSSLILGSQIGDIRYGSFKLNLYGVKWHYRFFNSKNSFYSSLSVGAAKFKYPDVWEVSSNHTIQNKEIEWRLGLRPEVGLDCGDFVISVAYIVPMVYHIANNRNIGAMQFSIGSRIG